MPEAGIEPRHRDTGILTGFLAAGGVLGCECDVFGEEQLPLIIVSIMKLTGVKHLLNARHFTSVIFYSLIILIIVVVT